jgi:hypothetical protein
VLRKKLAEGLIPDAQAGGVSLGMSDPQGSFLFNRAVEDGLAPLFRKQKLDILGFDACLMSNIETAYAMRNLADCLIGSQENEPGPGWNYPAFLSALRVQPDMSAPELARQIVTTFGGLYGTDGQNPKTTLSAMHLDLAAELSRRLSAFCDDAIPLISNAGFRSAVEAARHACENYADDPKSGYTNPIDLRRFLQVLGRQPFVPASLLDRIDFVLATLDRMVFENYASPDSQQQFGSSGLSIYFPPSLARLNADTFDLQGYDRSTCAVPSSFPVEFVCCEHWFEFLLTYLKAPSSLMFPPRC